MILSRMWSFKPHSTQYKMSKNGFLNVWVQTCMASPLIFTTFSPSSKLQIASHTIHLSQQDSCFYSLYTCSSLQKRYTGNSPIKWKQFCLLCLPQRTTVCLPLLHQDSLQAKLDTSISMKLQRNPDSHHFKVTKQWVKL